MPQRATADRASFAEMAPRVLLGRWNADWEVCAVARQEAASE